MLWITKASTLRLTVPYKCAVHNNLDLQDHTICPDCLQYAKLFPKSAIASRDSAMSDSKNLTSMMTKTNRVLCRLSCGIPMSRTEWKDFRDTVYIIKAIGESSLNNYNKHLETAMTEYAIYQLSLKVSESTILSRAEVMDMFNIKTGTISKYIKEIGQKGMRNFYKHDVEKLIRMSY